MISIGTKDFKRYLLALLLLTTACSSSTNFVVINSSPEPIELRYTLKKPANPATLSRLPEVPSVKAIAELDQQIAWRELPNTRFSFNPETRKVTVSLMPGEGLRIDQLDASNELPIKGTPPEAFSIEDIAIVGKRGVIQLRGDQVWTSFAIQSKTLRALIYR